LAGRLDRSPFFDDLRMSPRADGPSVMCHVWTAPSWQGLSSRLQRWSVQPCVRPVCAVHMTAGHNALRGSGPGQKPAFDNALAHVGCPDRRIDRLCITGCLPSQPSHHAGCRRDLVRRAPPRAAVCHLCWQPHRAVARHPCVRPARRSRTRQDGRGSH